MAIYVKRWNGSAWVNGAVKRWNGSSWVDAYTYKWNGSSWVQLYPETIVTTSKTLNTGGKFRSWRSNGYETTTSTTTFKQGPYSSYSAAYGYSDVTSSSLAGTGSISSLSSASIYATRGGSGSYGVDKTIYFYRSANAPDAVPTLLGSSFTATAKGVGSGNTFTSSLAVTNNTKDWTNQVNSGKYLWIYTNDSNHYLSLGPTFQVTLNYSYLATTALFLDDGTIAAFNMREEQYKHMGGDGKIYHQMPIYNEEVNMNLDEIIQRREDGIVEDINVQDANFTSEIKPWTRNYAVEEDDNGNLRAKIEVFNLGMDDEVQISLDKVKWTLMKQTDKDYNYMECILSPDYNKVTDWCYIRVINKKTDELYLTAEIEPMIMLAQ